MTLNQAIKRLGSESAAARAGEISVQLLRYWRRNGVPKWRKPDVDKIIQAASTVHVDKRKVA